MSQSGYKLKANIYSDLIRFDFATPPIAYVLTGNQAVSL